MTAITTFLLRLWQDRSPREQIMLTVMGTLGAVLLAQLMIAGPLLDFHARARDDYAASMRLFRSIDTDLRDYRQIQADTESVSHAAQPLRTVAGSLALGHGISLARMIPADDGQLTVNITRAETRALMAWLVDLETRYGIEVVSTAIDRESDLFVEANIVLRRRGGA